MEGSSLARLHIQEVRRRAAVEAAARAGSDKKSRANAYLEALSAELAKPAPDPILVADHAWDAGWAFLDAREPHRVIATVERVMPLLKAAFRPDGGTRLAIETGLRLIPLIDLCGRAIQPLDEVQATKVAKEIEGLLVSSQLSRQPATRFDGLIRIAVRMTQGGNRTAGQTFLALARTMWDTNEDVRVHGRFLEAGHLDQEAVESAVNAVDNGRDVSWLRRRPFRHDLERAAFCYGCHNWPDDPQGLHAIHVTCLVGKERRLRKLPIERLAEEAQVPLADLHSWEHGQSAPTAQSAARVARALDVEASILWPNGLAGGDPVDALDRKSQAQEATVTSVETTMRPQKDAKIPLKRPSG